MNNNTLSRWFAFIFVLSTVNNIFKTVYYVIFIISSVSNAYIAHKTRHLHRDVIGITTLRHHNKSTALFTVIFIQMDNE